MSRSLKKATAGRVDTSLSLQEPRRGLRQVNSPWQEALGYSGSTGGLSG